jgi:DNA-binding transcriptional regulator GbsR (MarR family)
MTNELPAPYVAASDTSRARANSEDLAGTTTKRRKQVSELLRSEYTYGMTWAEIAKRTGLHHGQVSGALSKLHEMGFVFQRRDTRNGCHPYVHADFRDQFDDNEVNDEPVKTRSTVLREAYEDLETAAWNLLYSQAGGSAEKWNHLRQAVKQLEELKND